MTLNAEQAQAFGIAIAAGLVWLGGWIGTRRSSGKPPDNRPPSQDEVRVLVSGLIESQKRIERGFREFEEADHDHKRELMKEIYRMGAKLDSLQRNSLTGGWEGSNSRSAHYRRRQNDNEN